MDAAGDLDGFAWRQTGNRPSGAIDLTGDTQAEPAVPCPQASGVGRAQVMGEGGASQSRGGAQALGGPEGMRGGGFEGDDFDLDMDALMEWGL